MPSQNQTVQAPRFQTSSLQDCAESFPGVQKPPLVVVCYSSEQTGALGSKLTKPPVSRVLSLTFQKSQGAYTCLLLRAATEDPGVWADALRCLWLLLGTWPHRDTVPRARAHTAGGGGRGGPGDQLAPWGGVQVALPSAQVHKAVSLWGDALHPAGGLGPPGRSWGLGACVE